MRSPRSTVGTMTDISSYLNRLFATPGVGHGPLCGTEVPIRTRNQIAEKLLALPEGTAVELRAPIFKIYGEDYDYLFAEIRKKGYRRLLIDGAMTDISEEIDLDEIVDHEMEVVVDQFVIKPTIEKQLKVSIDNALMVGERFLGIRLSDDTTPAPVAASFYRSFGCPRHYLVMGDLLPEHFMFNDPKSACRTCLGLGTYLQAHPDLLVPDKTRSIAEGAFVPQAFRCNWDTWDGKAMYSLSKHYDFGLDVPFQELPKEI